MRKIPFILTLFFVLFCSACNMDIAEIERNTVLEAITVDVSNAEKLSYLIGDSFNSNGIIIYGMYSDGSIKEEDSRLIEYKGFSSETANEALNITAVLGQFSASFNITILDAAITSIEIKQKPKKLYYLPGEALELDGMLVLANYTNGTQKWIENKDCEISGFDSTAVTPQQIITVSYMKDFKATFIVAIQPFDVEEIKINKLPNHLFYTKGDSLSLEGIEVFAKNTDGSVLKLESYLFQVSIISNDIDLTLTEQIMDISGLDAGDYYIKVSVNTCSDSFQIHILDAYQIGIALPNTNAGRIYCKGEIFKLSDYSFYQKMSNGELGEKIPYDEISSDMDGKNLNTEGITTISVTYTFFHKLKQTNETVVYNFEICVAKTKLVNITAVWTQGATQNGYPLGIKPTANSEYGSWAVNGILLDGTSIAIPADYCTFEFEDENLRNGKYNEAKKVINETDDKIKQYNVCVSYFDTLQECSFSCCFPVNVKPPVIVSADIIKFPRTEYICGENFALDGMEAKVCFSDNEFLLYNYGVNEDLFSSEVTTLIITGKNKVEIKIRNKYNNDDFKYILTVIVKENRLVSIDIGKKNEGDVYFRLGKQYTETDFFKHFSVTKHFEYKEDTTTFINNNVVFNFEKLQYLDNDSFTGVLYARYTENGKTYYGEYVSDASGNNGIILLPTLPVSLTTEKAESVNISNLAQKLKSANITYKVRYQDNTELTFTGDVFNNNTYSCNGVTYTINCNKNSIWLDWKADKMDCKETSLEAGKLYIEDFWYYGEEDLIKSVDFKKEKKLIFESENRIPEDLSTYFSATVEYITGCKITINGNQLNKSIDKENKLITVSYNGLKFQHSFSYSYSSNGD